MTEYNAGDLVEAVKGESVTRARVIRVDDSGGILRLDVLPWSRPALSVLTDAGFTLTVIERATPPLPTTDGIYFPRRTFEPHIRVLTRALGIWFDATGEVIDDDDFAWLNRMHASGDLTLFEPVPVTAKRVLERVAEVLRRGNVTRLPNEFSNLAAEFGVES